MMLAPALGGSSPVSDVVGFWDGLHSSAAYPQAQSYITANQISLHWSKSSDVDEPCRGNTNISPSNIVRGELDVGLLRSIVLEANKLPWLAMAHGRG
jgi:hypothetical protein